MTYQTNILRALKRFGTNGTTNPDEKHNAGRMIGTAFMWDTIASYAEKQAKLAWEAMRKEELLPPKEKLAPGQHVLTESPSFTVTARVTEPIRRFDPHALAEMLQKKYRVPVHTTLEMIEAAKLPTKSTVTLNIVEKGDGA